MVNENLAELRFKVLAFQSHVFGASELLPIPYDPAVKKLVTQMLRSELSLTKATIEKLPPAARSYISVALNLFEIKLRALKNSNDVMRLLIRPGVIEETTSKELSAAISAVLADVIEKSIGPSIELPRTRDHSSRQQKSLD